MGGCQKNGKSGVCVGVGYGWWWQKKIKFISIALASAFSTRENGESDGNELDFFLPDGDELEVELVQLEVLTVSKFKVSLISNKYNISRSHCQVYF